MNELKEIAYRLEGYNDDAFIITEAHKASIELNGEKKADGWTLTIYRQEKKAAENESN